jgi:sulfur relay protein TusD/DsrE
LGIIAGTPRQLAGSKETGDFTVKFLVVVNESPWASGLALCASRFVRAASASGHQISAIFFREDGVYNALPGELTDAGTPDLVKTWAELAAAADTRLLLCSSSRLRRLENNPSACFAESGLTEMFELMLQSDRVVSF